MTRILKGSQTFLSRNFHREIKETSKFHNGTDKGYPLKLQKITTSTITGPTLVPCALSFVNLKPRIKNVEIEWQIHRTLVNSCAAITITSTRPPRHLLPENHIVFLFHTLLSHLYTVVSWKRPFVPVYASSTYRLFWKSEQICNLLLSLLLSIKRNFLECWMRPQDFSKLKCKDDFLPE